MTYEEPVAVFTALGLVPVLFVHPEADVGDPPRSLRVYPDERIPRGADYVVGVQPGDEHHVSLDDVVPFDMSAGHRTAGRAPGDAAGDQPRITVARRCRPPDPARHIGA